MTEPSTDTLAIVHEPVERSSPDSSPATLPLDYRAYLLRLWRSGRDGNWRASLQSVRTGDRHVFADLESLFSFLVETSPIGTTTNEERNEI